ncbi:hypothetical protein [Spirosoma rhododendri]|uniref:DUF3828 domain-containing protein n=1 Tax=Spirosoma rhododendri TaxID=2728024 RepID=A0A7L5DQI5_9BACT|nr:hypothetical protein [Spirosoma rhododendri]QJD78307.1 hypothetical protein HH216_07620 [Spirosoma rhododendri]
MKHSLFLFAVLSILVSCQSKQKQADNTTESAAAPDSTASLAKRPGPEAPRSAADRLVRALYFEHQKTDNPFRTTDQTLVEQFFTKAISAQLVKSKPAVKNDLLFKTPDSRVKKTWVEPAAVGGSRAVVYATFEDKGEKKEVRLELNQIAGRWRISEMTYPDGSTLTGLLGK